jgi:hypothetical protein
MICYAVAGVFALYVLSCLVSIARNLIAYWKDDL